MHDLKTYTYKEIIRNLVNNYFDELFKIERYLFLDFTTELLQKESYSTWVKRISNINEFLKYKIEISMIVKKMFVSV